MEYACRLNGYHTSCGQKGVFMTRLDEFMKLLTGRFNNRQQWESLKDTDESFPYAEPRKYRMQRQNRGTSSGVRGVLFGGGELFYCQGTYPRRLPSLPFHGGGKGILLTSYEIPEGYDKSSFTYENLTRINYSDLKRSERFTPALYVEKDGCGRAGASACSPGFKVLPV